MRALPEVVEAPRDVLSLARAGVPRTPPWEIGPQLGGSILRALREVVEAPRNVLSLAQPGVPGTPLLKIGHRAPATMGRRTRWMIGTDSRRRSPNTRVWSGARPVFKGPGDITRLIPGELDVGSMWEIGTHWIAMSDPLTMGGRLGTPHTSNQRVYGRL